MALHNASTRSAGNYRRLLPLLILAAALFLPGPTFAQSVEPNTLTYKLQTGDSLTLYLTLTTSSSLAEVTFENNGLVNDERTANMPPEKIVITPESQATVEGQQRFAVAIQQPEEPGHFTGDLAIHYKDQPAGQALTISLDVTVVPKPEVAASAASPNQILQLLPGFFYLGDCSVTPNVLPAGGQIVITLEQSGLGEATLLDAKLDPLRATAQSLPGTVLSVSPVISPEQPLATTAKTADLTVKPASPCIPAGEYASGLRAVVGGQDDPIFVPFKVQSKAGLLWPLLITVLGILAGAFSYYLNRRIYPLTKSIQKAEGVQKTLTKPGWLEAKEVEKYAGLLKEIQDSMMGGDEPPKVEAALDDLSTQIKAAEVANVQKFVSVEVGGVQEALDGLPVGEKVAEKVKTTLGEIARRVNAGSYSSLASAREDLWDAEVQQKKLQEIAKAFNEVKQQAKAEADAGQTPQVDIQTLEKGLNQDEELTDLEGRIGIAQATYMGLAAAPPAPAAPEPFMAEKPSFETFATSLKVQRWIGVGLTGLFALVGGLIALYVPNPTWGAKMDDYITLAVWALSVNVIAGQSIDFKAQLKPQIQPGGSSPQEG